MIKKTTFTTPPHAVVCITCIHAMKLFTEQGHGMLSYLCAIDSEKNDGVYCGDYQDSAKFAKEVQNAKKEGLIT
jgi:hypothetical protein